MDKATIKKLEGLKARGYEIDERALRKAKFTLKRENRPEPVKPDPLHRLIEKLVGEIKSQSQSQAINTAQIMSQVVDALKDGLKELKPEPRKPKKWHFEVVRNKNGYDIEAEEKTR